jgi:hypothetical protein
MIPNRMILAETNVISIYGKPIFNNREPNIAPIKLAKLNTEAANVLANNGASCAFKIIILLSNGVVPNVPIIKIIKIKLLFFITVPLPFNYM